MKRWKENVYIAIICFATYFISIASILGSGILALPVKVGESGFWPFFCTFVLTLIAQAFDIVYMVELLQITEQVQIKREEEESNVEMVDLESENNQASFSLPLPISADAFEDTAMVIGDNEDEVPVYITNSVDIPGVEHNQDQISLLGENFVAVEEGGETLSEEESSTDGEIEPVEDEDYENENIEITEIPDSGILDNIGTPDEVAGMPSFIPEEEFPSQLIVPEEKVPKKIKKNMFLSEGPDMHTMGLLFLPNEVRWLYRLCIWVQYITILTSYALAGPQCIQKFLTLLGLSEIFLGAPLYYWFILPFVFFFTLIVLLGAKCIPFVITGMTMIKGSLLVLIVLLTGLVAVSVTNENPVETNWLRIGRPFLVGSVAVGGVVNVLPILYSRLPLGNKKKREEEGISVLEVTSAGMNTEEDKSAKESVKMLCCDRRANYIRLFKISSMLGLITCWILNIFWSYEVLAIVPAQHLGGALESETISTVPLINAIDENYPEFNWIGWMVDIFVLCSVSVSFICLGSSFKHVLDGWIKTFVIHKDFSSPESFKETNKKNPIYVRFIVRIQYAIKWLRKIDPLIFIQWGIYIGGFSLIYFLAQSFPKSFFMIMEIFTSFSINAQSGFFVCWMVWNATWKYRYGNKMSTVESKRGKEEQAKGTAIFSRFSVLKSRITTITRMNLWSVGMIIPVFLFFFFALVFDACCTGMKIVFFFVNIGREDMIEMPL